MFAFSFPFYTQGNGLVNACQIPMLVNGKTLFFGRALCGIIVPRPGIEPVLPALEAWSLNHWTAREVPERPLKGSHVLLY